MDSTFEVLGKDGDRAFVRTWQVTVDGTRTSVLATWSTGEPPTAAGQDRLFHEYALKDQLDSAWAVRPLELVRKGDRTVLVFADPGGEPLERLLGRPFETDRFVRLAVSIAAALGEVHLHGLVHKDVKPAHILVDESTGSVRLTGFGLATLLPRERQSPAPPENIAGTLAYMAPEQTGRMNRSIDARSDLYSLGITFYQMLTGSLPFTASEPMEWIHCHIARKPVPPGERVKRVPAQVSRIVMKLLAKTAEERYQTAAGLQHDLRRCLAAWEAVRQVNPFPLGERDIPDRLLIPEKLYGREREIATLLSAFDRVANEGTPALVLVSGYSGVGKSAVVNELHKVLVARRGLFASGKFDQYKRNIPYATLAQAFRSLVSQILGKSDTEMGQWRAAFREALGPNGQLIVSLVPQLALIIGEPPPPPDLPLQDQQARFQMVFRRFLCVFARSEHPLTLFLDDLQWMDPATLDLIEHLIAHPDVRHLLLVGAYRDNEVGPAHPLARTLARLRGAGGRVREIVLAALRPEDVAWLLADALHMEPGRVRPLAELMFEKTAGNPFFTIQFLLALAEQELLTFDSGMAAWTWDLPHIRLKGFTDNVADLMAAKLRRLPRASRKALGQLACLGNVANADTLALVHAEGEEATHAALWDAVRSGLVARSDCTYTFLHDRIREAAYALIREDARAMAHLRIGRVLATRTSAEDLEENIFDIVNQFGRGAALINTQEEREQVAQLNLLAGKRAKGATAYDAALQYFTAGRALVAETGWEQCYRLTFDLELNCAECEYLIGESASAEERLAMLSIRAQTMVDAAAATCLRINLYTTLDQSDSAVEVGVEYLRRVDDRWSSHPTAEDVRQAYDRLWQYLGEGSIEALLDLPLMRDPERCATMDVLTVLTSPALFTNLNLFRLVVSQMATLSLEHGNSDGSCLAYAWLGGVLGTYFGEYQAGFRFGRLGLDLVEKRGLGRFRARVYLVFAVHVAHWTQPLQTSLAFLRRAFEAALEAGDLSYAAYSCIDVITNRIATGDSLSDVEREAEHGLEFARKIGFGLVCDCITGQLRLIRMLRGQTPDFTSFNDAEFDEHRFEQRLENNPRLAIGASYYWIRRLQASIYGSDEASAMAAVSKAAPLLWTTPTQFESAEYHFYGAFAWAAHCDLNGAEQRPQHLEALASHHKQLAVWAENCPATFANREALVGAEIARLGGRDLDAIRLYEEAIRLARSDGFIQNEALAHERAAGFCTARGFPTMADAFLRNARRCYLSWGADGKVRQLDQLYPQLSEKEPVAGPTSTIQAPVEHLDLATVLKVSQAVSGEILLDKLLDTLMRTAIEHAGAERGLLILSHGIEQRIAAEAITSGDTIVVRLRDQALSASALSETIVQTVLRTQEAIILDDAAAEPAFAADPYIRQRHARSILCLPLVNQSKLIGVLYLENNLAARVFTPTRISVLRLVASQAAIALENTRLYHDLAEREAKIQRLVDANIIGIFFWDLEGPILGANDAFLRIVGYDREDLVAGRLRWTELTPPEWRDWHERIWTPELKMTGRVAPYEKEYFRKDGSRVPVLVGSASFDEARNRGVGFVLDLTERKRAEEALRVVQRELAHANRVATMGQLTASIAHEVKQPIAATIGNAEAAIRWLGHRPPDLDEVRDALSRIVKEGRRASEVIGRIRALVEKAPPLTDRLDINEAIREVIELTRGETVKNDVTVRTDLADGLALIHGDRVQLQQVLLNLIINAVEAMTEVSEGARELLIRTGEVEAGYVLVAVRDSGPGLDPKHAERLFETFYTTKASGMGMGLTICRSIIEAHGGRLWTSTNEPRGAVFHFTLPVGRDEVVRPDHHRPDAAV
ncbi:AAA family ATPase (plasmid) [Paraburkholderia sp. FT54]|uniref:trifunctional serine/threonine-protein kinase/ATP-binding protein/sensor histidine kinase n=1 Tax=Paraburkholderia sp. FT54 TaxID=3074437 RepID=UPI00287812C8|nr:AAA family ATPase [Paraburkholderia sp. FT54]WNC95492.1 AAA family ATPase [Paraburkholderia sp. FT54]